MLPLSLRTQGVALANLTQSASIDTMVADLAAGLRERGCHTRLALRALDPQAALVSALLYDLSRYPGPRFVLDVNAKCHIYAQDEQGRQTTAFDLLNLPLVAFFESNPLHHLEHIAQVPRRTLFTVVERGHRAILNMLGIADERILFLPHAGPPPVADVRPSRERTIPLMFLGNILPQANDREWGAQLNLGEAETQVAFEVLDQMAAGATDAFPLTLAALARRGLAPDIATLARIVPAVEARLNYRRRMETLQAIRSVPIHVFGEIAPGVRLNDNVVAAGSTPFATALSMMDHTRLLFNFMPFRTGAHERVFYGLSRGACVVSDPSSLLADGAAGEGGVILRAPPKDLDEQVRALVDDPDQLDRRREAGRAWYAQAHTWHHRAGDLLDGLRRAFFTNG